ncbi:MAG: DUF2214 domain-containing protein [Proteobacteria bacterium]|nr:MAG: DUF2214 domain-containing protein [Pseudomonadota bacterium]
MEAAFAYLHFIAIIGVASCLVAELSVCTLDLQPPYVRALARIDLLYLVCAVAALATGIVRLSLSPKGTAFYLHNPVLYIKLALFVAVGLASIPPTLQFLRWHRAIKSGQERILKDRDILSVRRYLALEVLLFACIPLAGVLMARGVGLQS